MAVWLLVVAGLSTNMAVGIGLAALLALDWYFDFSAVMALMAPVILIGGMTLGWFTPTEAAVAAVIWSLFLGLVRYRSMTLQTVAKATFDTIETTASVLFIVTAASIFAWLLTVSQAAQILTDAMLGITQNKWVFLLLANILILFVGCFIDTIAAITILVPILLPIVLKLGIDPIHFGLIMTLNLMIGLLHPPLGMVLFVLARVAKLSVERTTMAILPWLVPLLLALVAITYIPELTLWLPKYMGLVEMTSMALAATLFGPEDLRMVERPLDPLASGMVRIRFGAGGICGSDMHYYRHARTGDFVVTSPLVLGHEIAGEVDRDRRQRARPEDRRPRRGQSVALVRPLQAVPREPAQSLREHLLHGLGLEDAAHAGRLCQSLRCHPRAMRQDSGSRLLSGGSAGRAARGLPACGRPRRRRQRQARGAVRRRSDRPADHAGGAPRRHCRGHRRRYCRSAAGVCEPARRRSCRRHLRRRRGLEGELRARSTSRSKCRARRRALPAPSAPSGAAASWFRSAICRADRFRCRRMRSWPRRSTCAARSASDPNS